MTKDYYKILDIEDSSSQDIIKSAYRKLARKWHPDVAGNTSDVIAKFKEINEAYEVLSNSVKKADYDKARKFYNYSSQQTQTVNKNTSYNKNTTNPNFKETQHEKKAAGFNWEDFFKPKKEIKTPKRGEDIFSDVEISIFEAFSGTIKIINMLQTQVCPVCGGRKFVNGNKCSYCKGKGDISTYKKFNVKIPAGIKNGSKIRLAEEGEKGKNGGRNGDLYLTIHIREPQNYKTEGLNILKNIQITPAEAVLGASISIPTLIGNVMLKITPNTKNGQKIRLSGCGIKQNDKIGDMIVTVEIQIPQDLSVEEINLYKKLQELRGEKRVF